MYAFPSNMQEKIFRLVVLFIKKKTPSFFVSQDKQFYHCFGCGAHGKAIGFLMEYEQMSFYGAINYLANYAGISIPNQKGVVNRIVIDGLIQVLEDLQWRAVLDSLNKWVGSF